MIKLSKHWLRFDDSCSMFLYGMKEMNAGGKEWELSSIFKSSLGKMLDIFAEENSPSNG